MAPSILVIRMRRGEIPGISTTSSGQKAVEENSYAKMKTAMTIQTD